MNAFIKDLPPKKAFLALARIAKSAGNQTLVEQYCDNYKRFVLKERRKALTVTAANA